MGQSDISFSGAACNLGVIFYIELAMKEQVNKLCQLAYLRLEGSVQSDSIFLLKLPELSFPLLFSLGLIIALLALLAFLRFSLIKSRE